MTDTHAATELKLFIDNDAQLYRAQHVSIQKNLATKKVRSLYKHDLAVKLFGYLVESGAKKYAKEFGGTWHQLFSVPTRKAVAEELTKGFEGEYALGNYDYLLPKKYQKQEKASASHHATKKLKWKTPESIKVAWSPVNQAYFALWPGRGPVKDQQVLKIARADEMHDWLRETYGVAYGLAGRTSSGSHHATISSRRKTPAQLDREIAAALGNRRHN